MLKLKIKNLIGLVAVIVCVVNGVTLCQAMKKTSLNGKVNSNDKLEKEPIEINSVIDGIPIPKGTRFFDYDQMLSASQNWFKKEGIGCCIKPAYFMNRGNNKLIPSLGENCLYNGRLIKVYNIKFSFKYNENEKDEDEKEFSVKNNETDFEFSTKFLSTKFLSEISLKLLEKWLREVFEDAFIQEKLNYLKDKVFAFLGMTKIVHFFLNLGDRRNLVYLGSSEEDGFDVEKFDFDYFVKNCYFNEFFQCSNSRVLKSFS